MRAAWGVVAVTIVASVVSVRAAPPEMRTLLVPVERVPPLAVPLPGPNVLYINDCKPAGCTLVPGSEDSRTNTSSLIGQPRTLQPYSGDAATWDAMVACVRENYAPFNISVVTTDPGNVAHFEVMAAGAPTDIGFPGGVNGVAPFACGVVTNGISFAFANSNATDALWQCWITSQESAHVFGLEHSMLAADAMTYIEAPPAKRFVDETACIGTAGCCQPSVECQCGNTEINSYQRLAEVLGERAGAVTITSPAEGDVVPSGFPIRIAIETPRAVRKLEVSIDGVLVSRFTAPPFELTADPSLALGTHTITAYAEDVSGNASTAMISVVRGDAVQPPEPEPEPEPDPPLRTHETGCHASNAGGAGALAFMLAILVSGRRRRRAR